MFSEGWWFCFVGSVVRLRSMWASYALSQVIEKQCSIRNASLFFMFTVMDMKI